MNHRTFIQNDRAVASVIGFIFLIGFLVLVLTIYQAQVVPQQNAETELEHHQETRYELRSLHNAILAVSADQTPRFQSITLGTAYEGRTFGVNPPPAAGTIRTEQHNISISNGSDTENIPTQFIEYQPGYNELDIGSTWYENSVLYFDERDRGNSVGIIEDQEVVSDGNVTVVALQNEFQETGTGRVTLELYPSNDLNEFSLPEPNGNYTVKIPTRLNRTGYWESQLGDGVYENIDPVDDEDHDLLNLSVEPNAIEIDSVGISLEPNSIEEFDRNEGNGDQAGAIEVTPDVKSAGNSGMYEFGLQNTGDIDATIVALGINETTESNVVKVGGRNQDDILTAEGVGQIITDVIQFNNDDPNQAERYNFNTNIEIPQSEEQSFKFDRFREADNSNGRMKDEIVRITVWFSDGTSTTLLLDPNS